MVFWFRWHKSGSFAGPLDIFFFYKVKKQTILVVCYSFTRTPVMFFAFSSWASLKRSRSKQHLQGYFFYEAWPYNVMFFVCFLYLCTLFQNFVCAIFSENPWNELRCSARHIYCFVLNSFIRSVTRVCVFGAVLRNNLMATFCSLLPFGYSMGALQ